MYLPYNRNLKKFSRKLRKNSTIGEIMLWQELSKGKMNGFTFNRQKPLDNFIADFYCKPLNLVIEINGSIHDLEEVKEKDKIKQRIFEAMGLEVLRFKEKEIREHCKAIASIIRDKVEEIEKRDNIPPPKRRKG